MEEKHAAGDPALLTIGHSSRSIDEFLSLLESAQVDAIADVRRHAGSRAHPHFNPGPLAASLDARGIAYFAMPELGGRRVPRVDSPNSVWRNRSFRGYADYMESAGYREAIDRLLGFAAGRRLALLCAEALWWRCHRALIADDLKSRGIDVRHIMGPGKLAEHPYTPAARIVNGRLVYGSPAQEELFDGQSNTGAAGSENE